MPPLHDDVATQLGGLSLEPARPLIVTDADEVILQFVRGFEAYLDERGLYLELATFALTGNVRDKRTHEPLAAEAVRDHLAAFFADGAHRLEAVPGAAEALQALARRAQIVILSNVPMERRELRRDALRRLRMDYPLVANVGAKGAAVAHLAGQVRAPVFFLDDLPHNIGSVARAVEHVICVHFVADPRLARLLEPAEHCHARLDDWTAARAFIEERLDALGY